MNWSEQYDASLDDSEIIVVLETSLDPDFGEGSVIDITNIYESSSLRWTQEGYDLFYDLWGELTDYEDNAFSWNGETLYMRAKYVNERYVDGNWSSIESGYSNVVSATGPVIEKYDITISHGPYGFDTEGYATESYSITEGRTLHSMYCEPLEGCYVETVTVNDKVMYDKEDESTYELLYWWSDYTAFEFLDGEDVASEDLNIVITYGGTPTEKYGITTEWGNGGTLYADSYDSWNDNSLVVFHSSTPTITIRPYGGYEIDTVLINGEENAAAKEAGEYTFDPVIDDSNSIEVTFKRVAYDVSSYVYHGTITTDYEGYENSNYVKIGDDITFNFEPKQDEAGNYYEIERVLIDGTLNEAAKKAGTYTFEDVQASHSISVYYSEDPVITHDVTASSGDNGSISPEGVVHVKEGTTQRFNFIPDEGYEVDKVFVDDVEITNLASKEYYNIANVTEEHKIHVTFKKMPVQYDVKVIVSGDNPDVHTVNPKGVTPVWEGESFTVTYSPFTGYEVEKILINGKAGSNTGTYSIDKVQADQTIEIFFKVKSYKVTFVDYDGKVLKTETVPHGSKATPPADPTREHYVFTGWDTKYGSVTTNVTVKAQYKPATYTVEFIGWNGDVLKTETVEYTKDATAPTAPERDGYDFIGWSTGFTNVSSDLKVTAKYALKEYKVLFVDDDDTVLSEQTVKHGAAAAAPADPEKEGFTFIGWDTDAYGVVTSDMTIKAMYVEGEVAIYNIKATAYGNTGTLTPSGDIRIVEDGTVTVYFYPDALSKVVKVVVDGEEVELCDEYTFEGVDSDRQIDVYFAPSAVINVAEDDLDGGSANGYYDLIDDEMVYILDVTPDEGYYLEGIYINGEKADLEMLDGQYVIRGLAEDMDIEVNFALIPADDESDKPADDEGDKPADDEGDKPADDEGDKPADDEGDKPADDEGDKPADDEGDKPAKDDAVETDEDADQKDVPETGDAQNLGIWILVLLAGGIIGGGILYRKRKEF